MSNSKQKNKYRNVHDQLFKLVFSKKREAANLVRNFCNPVLVENLDFRTLKREVASFVEPDLKEYFSDLVYSCRWKGNELRLCLLFEHKSYPVAYPHFQLLRYMLNCWEQDLKEKRDLRPVIPIIVYHGKQRWKHKNLTDYFDIPDEQLKIFFPDFDYHLLDLSKYEDENILSLQTGFYVNTLLLLKHQRQKKFILTHLKDIFKDGEKYHLTNEGQTFIKTMLHYMHKTNKFEEHEKENIMDYLFGTNIEHIDPDNIDNSYDEMVMKGYVKGKAEGKVEGIAEGKVEVKEEMELRQFERIIKIFPDLSNEQIAELMGISTDRVIVLWETIK